MILYRAMCREEAAKTLTAQRPDFLRRFKWFSPDLDFVLTRVQDGKLTTHDINRFGTQRFYTLKLPMEWIFSDAGAKNGCLIGGKHSILVGLASIRRHL
jgi:hypothetical protein